MMIAPALIKLPLHQITRGSNPKCILIHATPQPLHISQPDLLTREPPTAPLPLSIRAAANSTHESQMASHQPRIWRSCGKPTMKVIYVHSFLIRNRQTPGRVLKMAFSAACGCSCFFHVLLAMATHWP
jgi:hypothetical protein